MVPPRLSSILLVDDDESTNFLNKLFIEKLDLDIDVHTVINGQEAINFLERKGPFKGDDYDITPCLLILDISMPLMNGWEFLKIYDKKFSKEQKDNIVIIMITISEDERDFVKAKKDTNIRDYIQKPMSDVKFKSLIHTYFKKEIAH